MQLPYLLIFILCTSSYYVFNISPESAIPTAPLLSIRLEHSSVFISNVMEKKNNKGRELMTAAILLGSGLHVFFLSYEGGTIQYMILDN